MIPIKGREVERQHEPLKVAAQQSPVLAPCHLVPFHEFQRILIESSRAIYKNHHPVDFLQFLHGLCLFQEFRRLFDGKFSLPVFHLSHQGIIPLLRPGE